MFMVRRLAATVSNLETVRVDAPDAESAAATACEDLIASGAMAAPFDVLVTDADGDVYRYTANPPPAFQLDEVDCCLRCGVAEGDADAPGWFDDQTCNRCAGVES